MNAQPASGTRSPRRQGRVVLALCAAALGAIAWLGWTSAGAQAALETLWVFCSAR